MLIAGVEKHNSCSPKSAPCLTEQRCAIISCNASNLVSTTAEILYCICRFGKLVVFRGKKTNKNKTGLGKKCYIKIKC